MSFWGDVMIGVAALPALGAGVVHGTYNVLTENGDFSDGFEETGGKWIEAAEEFGDKHSKELTRGTLSLAFTIAGALVGRQINPPST